MVLNFPNLSRSYVPSRHAIRFWGHDGAFEVHFFVEESALRHIAPETNRDEAGLLRCFDLNRERIFVAARQAHGRRRKDTYALNSSDF
jgi:hypothetical protein